METAQHNLYCDCIKRGLISHKLCIIQSRDCHKQISLHLTDEILCRGPGAGARHLYRSRGDGRGNAGV